ncbi:MAG: hypothetical protein Kow0010_25910 [Dehalococcoidia bacterium]
MIIAADGPLPAGTPLLLRQSSAEAAGEIRSCVRSPALDATIGLAVLNVQHAFPGTPLQTASGTDVSVTGKPFYRRRGTP